MSGARASLACRCGMAALVWGVLLAAASHGAEGASFRTVVVFGDTQDLVDSDLRDADLAGFRAMVDWVLAHREEQRIDFVLHVGDAISHGSALPLGPACLGADGRCDPSRRFSRVEGRSLPCLCRNLEAVDREWSRFNAEWRRFDGVIPYAIVPGNHDNLFGAEADGELDRPGFAAFYGPRHFEAVVGSGLVASHEDDQGISQAWRFRLGESPVLVIGAAHQLSPAALRWAQGVLDAHPGLPAIALAHQLFQGVPPRDDRPRPIWKRLVAPQADRFCMAVWGHVSPGEIRLVDVGGSRLLLVRSDWQGRGPPSTTLHLVRFHQQPGAPPEVEVLAFDPVRGRTVFERGPDRSAGARGRSWLPRQPLAFDARRCR